VHKNRVICYTKIEKSFARKSSNYAAIIYGDRVEFHKNIASALERVTKVAKQKNGKKT